jgi:transposase
MERGTKRRKFSAEFKADAVKLVLDGRSANQVSKELGIPGSCLGLWVRQSQIDAGEGPKGALTTAEKQELAELRREVKQLRMEREILKKAAAFFAKESE